MPRSRSSSRSPVRSIAPSRVSAASRPLSMAPPMPTVPAAAPSFGQTLKEGFGMGVGMSVADRVVGSIFGPRKVEVTGAPPAATQAAVANPATALPLQPCREQETLLQACLKKTQEGGFGCMPELQVYQDCLQKFSGHGPSKGLQG